MGRLWRKLGSLAFWVCWPLLYLYLRFSRRTRILVVLGDEVLMTKGWLGPDEWSLPGGGLHYKEAPAKGAARELFEETGLRVDPAKLKPLTSDPANLHGLRFFSYSFVVEFRVRPKLVNQRAEITDSRWMSGKDLLSETISPEVRPLLKQYFNV